MLSKSFLEHFLRCSWSTNVHKYLLLVSVTVTKLIKHYRFFRTMKMKLDTLQTISTDVNVNQRQHDDEKDMKF